MWIYLLISIIGGIYVFTLYIRFSKKLKHYIKGEHSWNK